VSAQSDEIIDCMARMKGDGQPFALVTVVRTEGATSAKLGAKAVIRADGSMVGWVGGGCTQGAARKAAGQALTDGRARMIRVRPDEAEAPAEGTQEFRNACASGGTIELFVEPMLPRPMLLVAGASPTARALCDLGRRVGFAVTVAALPGDLKYFPQADRRIEGFDLAGEDRAASSFIVVATQGKRDREALESALRTSARFVAFVGSRKKAAALQEQLLARGLDAERVAAVRAPAGLDIGSVTPEEIALSVLAEVVGERRKGALAEVARTVGPADDDATVETQIVPTAGAGCCGDGGKH
jgi:xanthine dehydrogenase accessory factor